MYIRVEVGRVNSGSAVKAEKVFRTAVQCVSHCDRLEANVIACCSFWFGNENWVIRGLMARDLSQQRTVTLITIRIGQP
jgi:hypothetical protein